MPDSLPGPRAGLQWAQCTAMVFDRAVKIEIWSDVVCPWCYIGKTNLEAALADSGNADDVEVVFRSFLLDPSAPVQPLSAVDHLAEKYGGGRAQALEMMRQVTAVAAGVGLEYHLEESLTGQTLDAHRLVIALHRAGVEQHAVIREHAERAKLLREIGRAHV